MGTLAASVLRILSIGFCLIVTASFVVFAADQAKGASASAQVAISGVATASTSRAPSAPVSQPNELHRALDSANGTLTSPFEGIAPASAGQWAQRGVELALALALYGFGFGYLARTIDSTG